jgi:hypothetical protein
MLTSNLVQAAQMMKASPCRFADMWLHCNLKQVLASAAVEVLLSPMTKFPEF